jgi:TolA-binding protein
MDGAIGYERQAIDYSTLEEFKAQSLMNIAWRYFKLKDYEKAAEAFKEVIDEYPKSAQAKEALLRYGDMLGYMGKQDEAIKVFTAYLERYPKDPEAASVKMNIAQCYYNKGDYEKAVEAFRRVLTEHPDSGVAKEALIEMGNSYAKAEKNEEAIKAFQSFIEKYPQDERVPEAMMNIAWRYRVVDRGKEKEVLLELNRRFPNTELGWFALGLYYEECGEAEKSIEPYKKAAEFHGSLRAICLLNLGESYYDIGEYDSAIETLSQLLVEYNDSLGESIRGDALFYLARCKEHKSDFSSAVKIYENLSMMRKYSSLLRMSNCYLQMGELEKAIDIWKEIVRNTRDTQTYHHIAQNLLATYQNFSNISLSHPSEKRDLRAKLLGQLIGRFWDFKMDLRKGKVLIVYGESENPEEMDIYRDIADLIKGWMERQEDAIALPCVGASTVTSKQLEENNLVLIGSPSNNKALALINDKLPIKIEKEGIRIGERVYEGKDLGLIMIAPNPLNEKKFVEIFFAFDPSLLDEAVFMRYEETFEHIDETDYIIFSSDFLKSNFRAIEQGFFFKVSPNGWEPFSAKSREGK